MLSLLIGSLSLQAQDYGLSFEEVDSLMKVEAKPIVVFLHADWCKYCQAMKKTTFQDDEVKAMLQEDYYFVSFNGEHREHVQFGGQTWRYQPTGYQTGEHGLARALVGPDGGYPTLVVMNEKHEILGQWSGFLQKKKFLEILEQLRA